MSSWIQRKALCLLACVPWQKVGAQLRWQAHVGFMANCWQARSEIGGFCLTLSVACSLPGLTWS